MIASALLNLDAAITPELTMEPLDERRLLLTRRRFFGRAAGSLGAGLGALASGALLGPAKLFAAPSRPVRPAGPGGDFAPAPHFAPKAKRVIYMHMEGAPSQLDLYDYKPGLRALRPGPARLDPQGASA
jgi:hypothetical protein